MNAGQQTTKLGDFILNAEQSIGQIAVQLPGATAIFRHLKLDFCCGGQKSLTQAASDKGLDVQAVIEELTALKRAVTPDVPTDSVAFIDHILERYHALHREQLPELIRMARRVESVHRDHPQVPAGLATLLELVEEDLLRHMVQQENILFPALKAGLNTLERMPAGAVRAEHANHGAMLEKLLALSDNASPPDGACNTWRALYAGLAQFHDDLTRHIQLESNTLYSQLEATQRVPVKSPCCGACG